jgi:hypothetical protein
MALTTDKYQLEVSFITDQSRALAKTLMETEKLPNELKKAQKEGKGVAEVMARIEAAGKKAEGIDLTKVLPDQLISRARQLRRILDQLPASAPQVAALEKEYKAINDQLATTRSRTRGVVAAMNKEDGGGLLGFFKRGQVAIVGFVAAFSGAFAVLSRIATTSALFQKFEAVLTNSLGSKSAAQSALNDLQDFAARTPFQVEELIGSYVKLVNRGLKPTQVELTKLGDIAASQGKGFDQLTEAVLDATTGEFERLKEFGIKGKKAGDDIAISFKGQTVEIKNTQEAILQAIVGFGDLEGVQGSTAAISATLGGKISNLTDQFTRLLKNLGEGFLGRIIAVAVDKVSKLVGMFVNLTDNTKTLSQSTALLQVAFNQEIATLERGNISTENRARLIARINDRYGELLPNMLQETTSLGEIKRAQELANRAFERKIILLAAEEAFVDTRKKQLLVVREELQLADQLTAAQEKAARAQRLAEASRARDQKFAGNNSVEEAAARELSGARAAVKENQKLQKELQKELDETSKAAEKLGLDLSQLGQPRGSDRTVTDGPAGPGSGDPLKEALKRLKENFDIQSQLAEQQRLREEISESDYQKRVLELQAAEYVLQLQLFKKFNANKTLAAEETRTELLRVEKELNRSAPAAVQSIEGGEQITRVDRRGINARLDALAKVEEEQGKITQDARNADLINEDQFAVAKLALKRLILSQEIEILGEGTTAEIALAREKKDELVAIDQELFDKRKELSMREQELRAELEQQKTAIATEGLSTLEDLLGRDEAARKKNAAVIKAFQAGQAYVAGFAEQQQIAAATAAQVATASLTVAGLALVPGIIAAGKLRAIFAGVRTAANVAKIVSTKFERGGKVGTFGGKSHRAGGTKLYGDDGTLVEVEKGEDFFVINKRSSDMRRRLSNMNVAGGGVPFFNRGGDVFNAPNTTPSLPASLLGGWQADNAALLERIDRLTAVTANVQTSLRATVSLTEINDGNADLAELFNISSV